MGLDSFGSCLKLEMICGRQCVQHNEKFLQRQEYWRDLARNAIDRPESAT